ncbi:hypothetical protein AB205_0111310 [Aquarana catesbeiana]|uniref:AAA ATPase AAA+ lid domain-containing protein n=1 Tax=Aquarana catesbeiana TaxID=8400 RepID=A0A2G9RTT0_AQUCT|nr:hypothetical protein AB205_0111310 [Aquarana catesbeiana]
MLLFWARSNCGNFQKVIAYECTGTVGFVVNQRSSEMHYLPSLTNVPNLISTDIIDPAILRPGRLDKTLYVGLPPPADRLAILRTITKNGTRPPLATDVDLEVIAFDERCDCFTGADLSALVREASINTLRAEMLEPGPIGCRVVHLGTSDLPQPLSSHSSYISMPPAPATCHWLAGRFCTMHVATSVSTRRQIEVYKRHFEAAFNKVKPSVSRKDQVMYEQLRLSLSR